jgi:glycosyltransferase involved in cell wall biosynthesis
MGNRDVCVITHPLSAAGENATRTLLDILAELGSVSLVTADLPAESTIRDNREVVELTQKGAGDSVPVAAVRFILNQLRMCAVLRQRSEDVVLFFGATAYLLPILFARAVDKTVLVEPRGNVPLTLRLNWEQRMPGLFARMLAGAVWLLERVGFATAHMVVTYTPNMARELGLNPESSDVYPHGARYVDTEQFRPTTPFAERDSVVGFVGRLDEEKGIRELADAAKRLPERVTFRFVGDGPLADWLKEELADEIHNGRVELTGWVEHDDIPVELNRMKLLVMPSHPTEGLPTTILEGMACGTPVYAMPVAGIPDVVRENETGFCMQQREGSSIMSDVTVILNEESLSMISEHARSLAVDQYSFDAAINRYKSLLTSV